ncbi:hypothetical protein N431DRAFT_471727 [Stipitochalara longipes BDJ]|nr:hypothetical protein N431DRAFT_471727 [Stipitochalara longipes BDJ]
MEGAGRPVRATRRGDPVAGRSAVNTPAALDPESRVGRDGRMRGAWSVERVGLGRSAAASLGWPVAGRNALTIKVDQGCGCPAAGGTREEPGCGWQNICMPTVAYLVAFFPSPPPTLGTQQSAHKGNQQQAGDVHSFIRLADYNTIQETKTRTIVRHSRSSQ